MFGLACLEWLVRRSMHKFLSYDVQCDKKLDPRALVALVLRLIRSSSVCNEKERKVHNPDVVDKGQTIC